MSVHNSRQLEKSKHKSAWSKVKGIVKTHRGSLKATTSKSSMGHASFECSRDVSPCESIEMGGSSYEVSTFNHVE